LKSVPPNKSALLARRRNEGGYAILLVLFLATLMLLATISVAPNIITQGRREKESEMIWRGKQYTRAIKLYYRKTGKFPTSMDDLIKPKLGSLRFMRQAYKDPMNKKDGAWRLIYVGPTGQLIGSLKPAQTLQLSGLSGPGTLPGTPAAQLGAQSAGRPLGQAAGQVLGNSGATAPSAAPPGTASSGSQPNTPGDASSATGTDATSTDASGAPTSASDAATEALLASEPTTVMGGNIIGVGSTVNQRSIVIYEKAKNYKQFEFIWDPSKDAIVVGGATGTQIGTPAGQPSGASPFGSPNNPNSPASPMNPAPNPPETPAPPQ
jgi:hypothetical protein